MPTTKVQSTKRVTYGKLVFQLRSSNKEIVLGMFQQSSGFRVTTGIQFRTPEDHPPSMVLTIACAECYPEKKPVRLQMWELHLTSKTDIESYVLHDYPSTATENTLQEALFRQHILDRNDQAGVKYRFTGDLGLVVFKFTPKTAIDYTVVEPSAKQFHQLDPIREFFRAMFTEHSSEPCHVFFFTNLYAPGSKRLLSNSLRTMMNCWEKERSFVMHPLYKGPLSQLGEAVADADSNLNSNVVAPTGAGLQPDQLTSSSMLTPQPVRTLTTSE